MLGILRKICAACLAFGSLQPTGILGLGAMLLGRDIEIPEAAPGLDLGFSDPVAMTALASFGGFRGWISNWLRLCVFWVSLSLLLEIGVWISTWILSAWSFFAFSGTPIGSVADVGHGHGDCLRRDDRKGIQLHDV